jgi:hypothetical protein
MDGVSASQKTEVMGDDRLWESGGLLDRADVEGGLVGAEDGEGDSQSRGCAQEVGMLAHALDSFFLLCGCLFSFRRAADVNWAGFGLISFPHCISDRG